jgi:hypothetical protein
MFRDMRLQPGFWRKCRTCFRWCRITVLSVVLALVCAFVWFNRIGLPDFLKARLVQALHSRGIGLEFSRMRLRVVRGLVAENVRIGGTKIPGGPELSIQELQLRLDFRALLHRQLQIDGLVLRHGNLLWPLSPTNALTLQNIQTDLRFQPDDTWSLDHFEADFAGVKLALAGDIAHASEIRDWEIFHGQKSGGNGALLEQLQKISATLGQVHYDSPPQLSLTVNGDARDLQSFTIRLAVAQARTRLELEGAEDDVTKNYLWRIQGAVEPEIIRPFLTDSNAVRGLDHFTFTEPLFLDVNVCGRLHDYDSLGATGRVALTNFTILAQTMDSVAGNFSYTNRVLEFYQPQLWRENGAQMMTADSVALNFNSWLVYITNGFGTADPEAITRAIGPKTARIIEPYHFFEPPTARVNGCVSMRDVNTMHDVDDADLRFDILQPAPFQWQKFRTPGIMGTIHWLGETLVLTNVTADFYGGRGNGFAYFDFRPPHPGADYQFMVAVTNVDLHALAADLSSITNHLEGVLAGRITVTHADTRDWQTWDGFGHATVRDGLLWDIPIFGILSPVLNTVSPGLGNSRATDASARFAITNGVIFTDSLEINSLMTRLDYAGAADLQQNVNARVTAQLLHNTWMVGPVISTVLWPVSKLFEYQITGTLKNPKSTPVYVVSKYLLMPLHPIRSFEEMFPAGETETNAPSVK